jgi:DNA polymerase-3 subunit delta'
MHPVVGHADTRRALVRACREDTLPAALLLMGPRGVGKQRMALWLSQLVLCEAPGPGGPCDTCRHCRRVLRLEHPDLHWFFPLARPKGVSGDKLGAALEELRNQHLADLREEPVQPSFSQEPVAIYLAAAQELRRKAQSAAAEGRGQIFIIANAEELVPQESMQEAANSLLKLLEEPPEGTRFILTSSEPGRLLDTIRSRTVPLHLGSVPVPEVSAFLEEHRGVTAEEADRAARLSGGSIGMALGFLPEGGEPGPLEELRQQARAVVRAGFTGRPAEGYALALQTGSSRSRLLLPLLDFVDIWLRDLAAVAADAPESVVNTDATEALQAVVKALGIHPASVTAALPRVERARREARGNVNPQLILAGLVSELQDCLVRVPLARPVST